MRFLGWLRGKPQQEGSRSVWPWPDPLGWMTFNGHQYPTDVAYSSPGERQEDVGRDFASLAQGGVAASSVVFACMRTRLSIFSEARFCFRRKRDGGLFTNDLLKPLEQPWPRGTTADLLARLIQDADIAGNGFMTRRAGGTLRRLRPDWVTIVMGSRTDPEVEAYDIDAEVIGYVYHPGGRGSGAKPEVLLPEFVAHFMPTPDPMASWRGMSWLTPVVREIMADKAATDHKLKFFENGATPNLVIKASPEITDDEEFEEYVQALRARNEGLANAYKTMILGGGADVTVVGADLRQLEFKATQGAGETRIAAAAGVHPVIVGLSEGLQGASLNAGNFNAARRAFGDVTMRYLWRQVCGALAPMLKVPTGAELWYDGSGVSFLQEDLIDTATIQQTQAQAVRQYMDAGFLPESVIAAIVNDDLKQLDHSGLFSVQLQPPGTKQQPDPTQNGKGTGQPDIVIP